MSLNGINNSANTYPSSVKNDTPTAATMNSNAKVKVKDLVVNETKSNEKNLEVLYTHSNDSDATKNNDKIQGLYTRDDRTIADLKADSDRKLEQLRSLVEKMLVKQGQVFNDSTDMFELLREGKLEVDPAVAKQAQADIAEDGYWGVEQTSDRLLSFAKALTGGNPAMIGKMRDALTKGFEEATKAWGGELPDISKKTYDLALTKFDNWASETTVS